MRVYKSKRRMPESDTVFYDLVKPIHEKHGATFLGRYLDQYGQYVVMWQYSSQEEMERIQEAVANDVDTISRKAIRISSGLHGIPFEEFILQQPEQIEP